MIILRMFSKKTHKEYIEREAERLKEKRELLKKTTPREDAQTEIMWRDTDSAGINRYTKNQIKSGLIGGAAGAIGGGILGSQKKLKMNGGKKAITIAGSAIVGNKLAKAMTHRKNERIKDEIWEKGDKESLEYLKSAPKKKRELEKNYIPIEKRVDKKGNYLKEEDYLPHDKSKNKSRLDNMESVIRVHRKMEKEIEKENKRREKK